MSGDSKTNQTPGCLGTACGAEVKFKIVFKTQTKWSSGWGKELPCFGPSELCDAWASRKDGKRKKKSGYNFRFSGPSLSSRKGLCTNQLIPVLLHGKHLQIFRGCQIHFLKDSHCVITPWARCPHCWCPWREDCRDVMLSELSVPKSQAMRSSESSLSWKSHPWVQTKGNLLLCVMSPAWMKHWLWTRENVYPTWSPLHQLMNIMRKGKQEAERSEDL